VALDIQVTFDVHDHEVMSRFWALALDHEDEPPPPGFSSGTTSPRAIRYGPSCGARRSSIPSASGRGCSSSRCRRVIVLK